MTLDGFLNARRAELVQRWSAAVLATYPQQATGFFSGESDPFRNPVGATVRRSLTAVVDALVRRDHQAAAAGLDDLIRMRAVQSFTPAEAVGFVLALKGIVRGLLASERTPPSDGEMLELDERIDRLTLAAFDLYAARREQIAGLKVRETMARTYTLLKRAGAIENCEEGTMTSEGVKGGQQA